MTTPYQCNNFSESAVWIQRIELFNTEDPEYQCALARTPERLRLSLLPARGPEFLTKKPPRTGRGDPQVGIPEVFAKKLSFGENVNQFNIRRLRQAVLNGPNKWPGANYIIDGEPRELMPPFLTLCLRRRW